MLKTKSCSKYLKIKDSIEEIESKLKESYSSRRMEKERSAIQRMKKDPAYFFNYAKKFAKTKSEVGPFIDDQGDLVSKKEDIVNMLKSQYESVYSTPDVNMKVEQPEEFFQHSEANEQLDSVVFDRMDVLEALGKLSNKSSPGPDGIPSILLKKCRYGIVDGLLIVFQKIFSSGNIPVALKTAFVIPIHKGGSRASPVNFRPVSLTSHIIKTLERVIRVSLVRHLELHEKINPNQHGFRHQRSCLSHLLAHHDQILSYLEEGHNVDSVYLDFSKAFDKVDIGILCHKLRDLGIHGKLGQWLHNFLTSREQYIVVNGTVSNVSHVTSGVPQGTVLGPILFLILINDIDNNVKNHVSLFCDDTRVMGPVDSELDVENLQGDLDTIYDWQDTNNMQFNGKKFEMLRYGPNTDLKNSTNYLTPEYEDIIEVKENLRDLGVIISDDATFTNHIHHVCKKVKQKAGWIFRTFLTRNTKVMKFLWKSLIQGHIDYCSQLYMPNKSSELQMIENLQQWYTKRLPEIQNQDYWTRLKSLCMLSQQRRLERYRIIYTWKILEELAPNCGLTVQPSGRRGREFKVPLLRGKPSIKTLRSQSFQVNGPQLFNSLPVNIRNLTKVSVGEYKEKLDKFLMKIPDEPKVDGLTPGACNQWTAAPSNSIIDQVRRVQLRGVGS